MSHDDFDAIIDMAKRTVGLQQRITADVYPHGVVLDCRACGYSTRRTSQQAARYLTTGWPKHCGRAMNVERAEPQPNGTNA